MYAGNRLFKSADSLVVIIPSLVLIRIEFI